MPSPKPINSVPLAAFSTQGEVTDDSALMRRQIRTLLELDTDIEVCGEAANGLEAVQKAQECFPDLVVIDVLMPVMNGLEATREIKKLLPSLPVLIFTLDSSAQVESESGQAGADAILVKAEGAARLSGVIHFLLQRN
ncbi:MAG: response regulator transcription factor [Candidatus Korobacteraceae bacterium]